MFNSKFYIGVVESRDDPEKMGRCKVRVFGIHSDSKILLPTRDLPWAIPLLPTTSASISGLGISPTGIVPGSWVLLIMLDGDDCQQPMILGSILSKSMDANSIVPRKEELININNGILRTNDGVEVKDSDGFPVRFGIPKKEGWYLGKTSEQHESGGRGPGVINDYLGGSSGDYGGASYGMFQFASYLPTNNRRPAIKNSPVKAFIANSKYKSKFDGMEPATRAFDDMWRLIASTYPDFEDEQREYIKRKYYDVAMSNIMRFGIDLSKYGPGVQDLVWSTAVQLGPNNTGVYKFPLGGKSELDDKSIIQLVSEYKIANVGNLFRSSSEMIRNNVRNRWRQEEQDLIALTNG